MKKVFCKEAWAVSFNDMPSTMKMKAVSIMSAALRSSWVDECDGLTEQECADIGYSTHPEDWFIEEWLYEVIKGAR